jgi:hypothetical protein
MKYAEPRPFADPEKAALKLLEIANATEAVQDGRIYIEAINAQFQFKEGGTPEEYRAGLACAVTKGWLWKHESGTYVKFTQACSRRVEQSNDVIATDSPRRRFPACHGERKNSLPSFPILARVDITNHSASCIGTGGNTSALYIVGRNCHVSSFYLTDRLAHSQRSGLRRDLI